jgi:hypothetical protein
MGYDRGGFLFVAMKIGLWTVVTSEIVVGRFTPEVVYSIFETKKLTRHTINFVINNIRSSPLGTCSIHEFRHRSRDQRKGAGSWERNRSRSNDTHPHTSFNLDLFNNYYLHHHHYHIPINEYYKMVSNLRPPRCKNLAKY